MQRGQYEKDNLAQRIENLQPVIAQMDLETKFNFCFELFQGFVDKNLLTLDTRSFTRFLCGVQIVFDLTIEEQNHFLALFRQKLLEKYSNE